MLVRFRPGTPKNISHFRHHGRIPNPRRPAPAVRTKIGALPCGRRGLAWQVDWSRCKPPAQGRLPPPCEGSWRPSGRQHLRRRGMARKWAKNGRKGLHEGSATATASKPPPKPWKCPPWLPDAKGLPLLFVQGNGSPPARMGERGRCDRRRRDGPKEKRARRPALIGWLVGLFLRPARLLG